MLAIAAFTVAMGASWGLSTAGTRADELNSSAPPAVSDVPAESPSEESAVEAESTEAESTRSLASLLPLITDEAVAGAVVYPRQFLDSTTVRCLPVEVVAADLENHLGVNLRKIEFAIAFLERGPGQPLSLGVIVKFADDFDWRRIPQSLLRETVFGTLDGRPYRKGRGALDLSLLSLDRRTMILAPDQTLIRMLATRELMPSDTSISQQLSHGIGKSLDIHLVANTESFRPLVALQLEQPGGQAEAWRSIAQLLDDIARFELRARLSQQFAVGAVLDATSNAAAVQMQATWEGWNQALAGSGDGATAGTSPRSPRPSNEEPTVLPDNETRDQLRQFRRYIQRSFQERLAGQSLRVTGNRLQWGMRGDPAAQISACAAIAMLLSPAVQAFTPTVDRWQSMDSLQRLSNAMLAYARVHERFPARQFLDRRAAVTQLASPSASFLGTSAVVREVRPGRGLGWAPQSRVDSTDADGVPESAAAPRLPHHLHGPRGGRHHVRRARGASAARYP